MFSFHKFSQTLLQSAEFSDYTLAPNSFSIDTRTIKPNDVFVALRGEKVDGHKFIKDAFKKDASGVIAEKSSRDFVLSETKDAPRRNIFFVDEPAKEMTRLASEYRESLLLDVIGITGSAGKTTTKTFLSYLLSRKARTISTEGNLNNQLGVPLMVSRILPEHKYAALEFGASHMGDIKELCEIARPTAGILTPIGAAHLAGFGTLENVYKTKLELADYLPKSAPLVVLDNDDFLLNELKKSGRKFITVGTGSKADRKISDIAAADGKVSFCLDGHGPFSFPSQASFYVQNAALALSLALELVLSWNDIPDAWDEVRFSAGRFHEETLSNGVRVIDDCYNANPISFKNALAAFKLLNVSGKKIVVFSDMRELGDGEVEFHRQIGREIAGAEVDLALAFGELAYYAIETARDTVNARHFLSHEEILKVLKSTLRAGDAVLFKGSRSMRVERILNGLK